MTLPADVADRIDPDDTRAKAGKILSAIFDKRLRYFVDTTEDEDYFLSELTNFMVKVFPKPIPVPEKPPKKENDKIKKARAISWIEVLIFAILETGTLTLIFARYSLKPETAISLKSIIKAGIVSQSAITSFEVRISITDATSNLSAIGSKNVPKLVTSFLILAIYSSK